MDKNYYDPEEWSGWAGEDYQLIKKQYMNYKPLLSALVSGVIVAVLGYVVSVTDIWAINLHSVINIAVMTAATSLLKYFGTTSQGNFAGVVPVVPPQS